MPTPKKKHDESVPFHVALTGGNPNNRRRLIEQAEAFKRLRELWVPKPLAVYPPVRWFGDRLIDND